MKANPKKENRGGKRSGAGGKPKPPKQYDRALKDRILAAIKEQENKTDKTVEQLFAEMLFDEKVQASVRQANFKQYFEMFIPKQLAITSDVPKICLPPIQEPEKEKKDG